MSTPRLGNKGCPLCSDRSIPENLNTHVNDSQTCADVHLQLAMLRYDNAMCAVGQEKYQELCCAANTTDGFTSMMPVMIGVAVAGLFLKKIFSSRKRRIKQESDGYYSEDLPGTVSFSSRSSRSSRNSSRNGTIDLEMPSSGYVNMDQPMSKSRNKSPRSNRGRQGRHPSRSRDVSRFELEQNNRLDKTRSSSRSRGGRNESRARNRSMSRSRPREMNETKRSSRDRPTSRSRARSRSRPRDMSETTRSNRDRPTSRSRAHSRGRPRDMSEGTRANRDRPVSRSRAHSRSRPRDMLEQTHSSMDRPRSRSRARSRSRPREMMDSNARNRTKTGRSRSRSRPRNRPEYEEVDRYYGNGARFPTQVL